jgi:hypothetical protein
MHRIMIYFRVRLFPTLATPTLATILFLLATTVFSADLYDIEERPGPMTAGRLGKKFEKTVTESSASPFEPGKALRPPFSAQKTSVLSLAPRSLLI